MEVVGFDEIDQLLAQCTSTRQVQLLWNKHVLFIVENNCIELVQKFEEKLGGSNLIQKSADMILDQIISASPPRARLAEIALFITAEDPKLHILIDLVRQCHSLECIWELQLLGVVSKRIKGAQMDSAENDDTNKLSLAELLANEIIYKVKYALDGVPIENSIYAVQILINCIQALGREPRVQIVRMNEILDMLTFFIHDPDADDKENELRLVTSLEFVHVILEADHTVVDFFQKRLETEILSLVKDKQYSQPTELQAKLQSSCQFVLKKLLPS